MDEFRAQLDALMGEDRNVPLAERDERRSKRKFNDENVCKYHLCGFCPYEEFRRTKNDCGDCPCIHDDNCRKQYEELDDRSKDRYGYEADLLRWFERLLSDLRKRIDTNTERLRSSEVPVMLIEDQQRLDNMGQQISELVARAAMLGEQGDIDGAQAAAAEAERLKVQRSVFEQQAQSRAQSKAGRLGLQNQQVCQISGLIINNEESRLQDHYSGRNYNSWKKLHEVHAKLLEAQRARRGGGYRGGSSRDERDSRRYDDRDRRRYDDRDRRDRDRDRDRDYRSSRSRDDRSRRDDRRYDDRDRRRPDDRDYRRRERSPPKADVAPDEDVEFTVAFDAKKPEKELPRLNLPPAPGSAPAPAAAPLPPTLPVPNAAAAALGAGSEANLLPVPAGPQMPTEPGPY
ncbi:Luc7 3 [Chlorella sorokiniana]|uniref:Luc7 3 n=1 Tax=Chlorella sorokiniana TaxID=3076 RepID=A0A2P6TJ03_CHLSO|nr:Luc7 3 [Chlorella sorokiniana]|eukprot:PRW39225.1 Luc7 3 [Chlorella sorokiniana]